jgi:hypothetical protein
MSGNDEQVVVIRVPEAQIVLAPDGSATIMEAGKNTIVLRGKCADTVKAQHEKFKEPRSDKRLLKITLEIEVPQPVAKFLG